MLSSIQVHYIHIGMNDKLLPYVTSKWYYVFLYLKFLCAFISLRFTSCVLYPDRIVVYSVVHNGRTVYI